jgi:predicted acyl esterase
MEWSYRLLVFAFISTTACSGSAPFKVRESVEQLQVTHAPPGAMLAVFDGTGAMVQSAATDAQGSLMFRHLTPGDGYTVRELDGRRASTGHLKVMSVAGSQPPQSFYNDQKLTPGFHYIHTRDGTTLSAYVTLPGPVENGPYPTVVDYSGYDPSRPGMPIDGASFLCDQFAALCDAPNDPAGLLAALFGYATVSVNIRGTGCSGGAYDFFEKLQLLDGYDVIETVAAQSWVMHHKVGMVGLSYPGISQLFVGWQRPPSLAAISPLSVIGNAATTLLPGGILNEGFAVTWINEVLSRADPYGQGWEMDRVKAGDQQCAENQLLHSQKIDNVAIARNTKFYDPVADDQFNPTTFVDQVDVPVFIAGQWQDEQTGPFFTTLLNQFSGAPALRVSVHNGVHPDGFAPQVLSEWYAFLELFVAQRVPLDPTGFRDASPILFNRVFQSGERLPAIRWVNEPSYDAAVADWKAQPPVRALFDSGAGNLQDPGAPDAAFEQSFSKWPPAETQTLRLYLQPDGSLGASAPTAPAAASSWQLDPTAGERLNLAPNGNVWDKLPAYAWTPPAPGFAVVFEGAPLATDAVMMGTGSADLWIKAPVDDVDIQVTISEVRPDGNETYVQSGWLRASYRALGPDSTELWPSPTYQQKDYSPLTPGQWTPVRVAIAGFGHTFRAGSRVRFTVDTPGGTRAAWQFALLTFPGTVLYALGHDAAHPSSVALPLLMGVTAPTPLPPCASLRGQPCRAHAAYVNTPAN